MPEAKAHLHVFQITVCPTSEKKSIKYCIKAGRYAYPSALLTKIAKINLFTGFLKSRKRSTPTYQLVHPSRYTPRRASDGNSWRKPSLSPRESDKRFWKTYHRKTLFSLLPAWLARQKAWPPTPERVAPQNKSLATRSQNPGQRCSQHPWSRKRLSKVITTWQTKRWSVNRTSLSTLPSTKPVQRQKQCERKPGNNCTHDF